jgi:hypothetical protein
MDPQMIEVLRAKTGAERLAIGAGMFRAARGMIKSQLRAEHPDWDEDTLQQAVNRRLAGGPG